MKGSNVKIMAVTAAVIAVILVGSFIFDHESGDMEGQVIILHTNDTHGFYDENLGFAAVAELRDSYEARGATVFLLDAGDAFQGTATTSLSRGESSIDVLNAVGYDVMCPGNHEFDYTLDTYLGYADRLEFPTICSNLDWRDSGESVFDEFAVIERDGVYLGVFGLLTPDTESMVMAGYMDDVVVTDPTEAAREMVAKLRSAGADYIVALTHIGVDRSSSYTSDYLVSEVDGIDVCIDGHSHTEMENGRVVDGSIDLMPSDTIVASTGTAILKIGVVELSDSGVTATLSDSQDRDREVQGVIDDLRSGMEGYLSEKIGSTEITLTGERTQSRLGEVLVGDLAADSMRESAGADVAVVNGGTIRLEIPMGDITIGDAYGAYPFDNYVQVKTVTGSELYDIMETSVGWLPGAAGSYLQVSGMVVTYDSSRESGDRVIGITLSDGTPIGLSETYAVASNDYIMSSSDYPALSEKDVESTLDVMARDLLIAHIMEMGTISEGDILTGRLIDQSAI